MEADVVLWNVTTLKSSNKIYNCSGGYILGGYGITKIGSQYSRMYNNLPPHNMIHYSFELWLLDSWNLDELLNITLDSTVQVVIQDVVYTSFPEKVCGSTSYSDLIQVKLFGKLHHSNSSLNLDFNFHSDEDSTRESLGIKNLNLLFLNNTIANFTDYWCVQNVGTSKLAPYQCVCPSNSFNSSTGSCKICSVGCEKCFGNSDTYCLECAPGYDFIDDKCSCMTSSCGDPCKYPLILNGSYCIYPCSSGKIVYFNGSCGTGCSFPFINMTYNYGNVCELMCADVNTYVNQWDNTCSPSCSETADTVNGFKICYKSCEYPLVLNKSAGYVCQYPCPSGKTYYYNGTCGPSCFFPFTTVTYSKNDDVCEFICPDENDFVNTWDNSCSTNCIAIAIVQGGFNVCTPGEYPCPLGKIYYYNGSCETSCDFPLSINSSYVVGGDVCEFICPNINDFVNSWDNSCAPNCVGVATVKENFNVCILPTCQYPLVLDVYRCNYPCTSGKILNYNGDCIDNCEFPFAINNSYSGGSVCEFMCADRSLFVNPWNHSCDSKCFSRPRKQDIYNVCDPPLCGASSCPRCQNSSQCSENYVCNVTMGGFCVLNRQYVLSAKVLKNLAQGYLIMLEIIPSHELIDVENDNMIVSIDGLVSGVDYTSTVTQISVTVFHVSIEILKSLSIGPMQTHFTFSPSNLNLKTQLSLPKIIFISQAVQETAENIGSGSNYASYIFLICMLCFAVLGNLNKVWSFLALNQYMNYFLYFNLGYLSPTQMYLKSLNNYSLVFLKKDSDSVAISSQLGDLEKGWPQRFLAEDYSTNLFESSGQIFGIIGSMLLAVAISSWVNFQKFSFYIVVISLKSYLKWNGLFQQMRTYTLPLLISCLLQVNLAIFSKQEKFLFLLISIIVLLGGVFFLTKMFSILSNIPHKKDQRFLYSLSYGVLWKGLNINSKYSRYYYFIVLTRSVLLAYLCVLFDLYPYAQIIGVTVFQCAIVIFHFEKWSKFRKIFQENIINYISFTIETFLLLMKISLLAYYFINQNVSNEDIILYSSLSIVAIGGAIQVIMIGFMLYMQYKNRRKMLLMLKNLFRKISGKQRKMKIIRVFPDELKVTNTCVSRAKNFKVSRNTFHKVHL